MSIRRKIISAVLCGVLTLVVTLALEKTQAHADASLPAVTGTSSAGTACGVFTYSCPPPTLLPTQPLPVQVRHWYPVQTPFYYSGP